MVAALLVEKLGLSYTLHEREKPHMQTHKVSPELQAVSDRAYLYAYGIDEAYKHLYKTLVEPDYPANRFKIIRHLADDKYTAHVSINNDTLHLMGWLDVAAGQDRKRLTPPGRGSPANPF
jgi:hypothetical protein